MHWGELIHTFEICKVLLILQWGEKKEKKKKKEKKGPKTKQKNKKKKKKFWGRGGIPFFWQQTGKKIE